MKYAAIALCALLSACGGTIVQDRPVTVLKPVAQPCALPRPEPVSTLKERYPDEQWGAMDVKMKAAAVSKQALDLRTYGEALNAATAGCP